MIKLESIVKYINQQISADKIGSILEWNERFGLIKKEPGGSSERSTNHYDACPEVSCH